MNTGSSKGYNAKVIRLQVGEGIHIMVISMRKIISEVLALSLVAFLSVESVEAKPKDNVSKSADVLSNDQKSAEPYGAPFGLKWGMTPDEARSSGIELSSEKIDGNLSAYSATNLPSQPSSTDFTTIIFSNNRGLQKIIWNSQNITGDSNGAKGKSEFKSYQEVLEEKYGKPAPSKTIKKYGLRLYKESDEFYQCLNYDGCGYWFALWELQSMVIMMEVKSLGRRGEGWISITYEGPEWSETLSDRREQEKKKKKSSF